MIYDLLKSPATFCEFDRIYFSLTLTLSLREREQQASDWCSADGRSANSVADVIETRWTFLPLPRGEGGGEGEPTIAHPKVQSARTAGSVGSRRGSSIVNRKS